MLGLFPSGLWPAALAVGAGTSLAVLALYFHPWLVIGVVIDLALLAVVMIARWSPDALGS